jgi:hypothetical protein
LEPPTESSRIFGIGPTREGACGRRFCERAWLDEST